LALFCCGHTTSDIREASGAKSGGLRRVGRRGGHLCLIERALAHDPDLQTRFAALEITEKRPFGLRTLNARDVEKLFN
jgi:hypothetical protein